MQRAALASGRRAVRIVSKLLDPKPMLLMASVLAAGWTAGAASAAEWPTQPVRVVAPYAAGGAGDTLGRLVTEPLSTVFKRPFVMENRPGASGIIGTLAVTKAEPDGYTLMITSISAHVFAPATQNTGYDPVKDFTHIAYFGGPPIVLVAHPSLGVKSFQELRELLKNGDKELAYNSPGVGSLGHLVPEFVAKKDHLKLNHIPYKGSSQAVQDLVAGHVKLGSLTWTTALSQIRAGRLIPLAVTSARRLPGAPDIPTFAELGYPEMVVTTWYGLSAPAGLDRDIVNRLNRESIRVLKRREVKAYLDREGIETEPMTPEAYTAFVQAEFDKWRPIVESVGLVK
jgi:tripartite-type tricarboxylate transporter receptor subunit TctC